MKISPARVAAFEILLRIETEKAFSSELLPLYEENLAENDRSLCHHLTLGTLRNKLQIDYILGNFTGGKKLDTAVRIALRLGIYQLLFLSKVPDYSAVNESVNLVQYAKKTSAKGFVNAVLRRATRVNIVHEFADEFERISIETSHPRWLIEKWADQFGIADAEELAASNNNIPGTAFRILPGAAYGRQFEQAVRSEFVENCFIANANSAELVAAAEAGEIYFQDEGSQMVAAAVELVPNGRFLDLCAAPGSKFTQIAAKSNIGQMFAAGDLHSHRVRFLRENCVRQGLSEVNIVQYDAEHSIPFADASFDTILIDAPCSGTGTIRHNPEIRYSVEPSDFAELARKQLALLQNASNLLKNGGRLIYSTCSLEREENEHVADAFIANSPEFGKARPKVPGRFIDADGYARTLPYRDNMDGFFIATFEKAAA